jgi:hypothetical protein
MKSPEEIDQDYTDGLVTLEEAVGLKMEWVAEQVREALDKPLEPVTADGVRAANARLMQQADETMAFWMEQFPEIRKPKLTADYEYSEKLKVFRLLGFQVAYEYHPKKPLKFVHFKLLDDLED